jgi:nucleotide-binding universal stress UspA family protein
MVLEMQWMSPEAVMIRIQKILCPVDFFPASKSAADYAIALAKNYNAKLTFLHVVEPVGVAGYEVPFNMTDFIEAQTKAATTELARLCKRAEGKGIRAESLVRTGNVDSEITDVINERKANFIVMGTHGRRGFERWFIGSVTERLLRRTNVPLLTIGSPKTRVAPPSIRRILVATDFSAGTTDAVATALSIAQECQAKITLMHVLDDISADVAGRYRDSLIESIREKLEGLIPDDVRNWCEVTTRVETGLPGRRIPSILKNERYDLLVMNIHGKGMLDRVMIGSTAERVVRSAAIPVLFIPPKAAAKRQKKTNRKAA